MKKIALTALGAAMLLTAATSTPVLAQTPNAAGSPTAAVDNAYMDQIGSNALDNRSVANVQGAGSDNVNMTNTPGSMIENSGRRDVNFVISDTDAIGADTAGQVYIHLTAGASAG